VCFAAGEPLQIIELDVPAPADGEVVVRMGAAGVCHTDWAIASGEFPFELPMVLGHEGAGVVEAVGPGVETVAPGDHVVLSWVQRCGQCYWCDRGQPHLCGPGSMASLGGGRSDFTPRLAFDGATVRQMLGLGTFSEVVVTAESAVVPISRDIPMPVAALVGCAILTGVGAALNTTEIGPGDTVVVVGCGGVGLNVVQGAAIAGAGRVIAVDRMPGKLALAQKVGATDLVDASATNAAAAVAELTGGIGGDVVFEVVGRTDTAEQALAMTRAGGQVCIVGMAPATAVLPVATAVELLMHEKRILGCKYGSCDTQRDVPGFLDLWRGGQLQVEPLIGRTIRLDEVGSALTDFGRSDVARTVIEFDA
jgi:Zn-dependent alcohol dehydrogenase